MKAILCTVLLLCAGAPLPSTPAAATGEASNTPRWSLLVVNQGDATVSVIDPASRQKLATIPEDVPAMVGHEIAASPDGRFAYVPLYGDSGVGRPGSDGDRILMVDLQQRKVVRQMRFDHGVRPHCIVFDPVSKQLYVTTELDQSITVIDPQSLKIAGAIPTRQAQSHMLAISHDGRRGYTANVGPGTVSVLDLVARKFVTTIPIAKTTQRISVSRDDKWVFTADQTTPRMAIIDTAINSVQSWLPLPAIGYGSTTTANNRWLLVTMPAAGELAIVDLKSKQVVRTVKVGLRPQEVLLSPDGATAYVSCLGGHQIAVVDTSTWQLKSTLDAGEKADGMAWAAAPN